MLFHFIHLFRKRATDYLSTDKASGFRIKKSKESKNHGSLYTYSANFWFFLRHSSRAYSHFMGRLKNVESDLQNVLLEYGVNIQISEFQHKEIRDCTFKKLR